jgi:hypothetical protein
MAPSAAQAVAYWGIMTGRRTRESDSPRLRPVGRVTCTHSYRFGWTTGAPLPAVNGGKGKQVTGFSIMEADPADALQKALDGYPHSHLPGGVIEAFEFLATPGR